MVAISSTTKRPLVHYEFFFKYSVSFHLPTIHLCHMFWKIVGYDMLKTWHLECNNNKLIYSPTEIKYIWYKLWNVNKHIKIDKIVIFSFNQLQLMQLCHMFLRKNDSLFCLFSCLQWNGRCHIFRTCFHILWQTCVTSVQLMTDWKYHKHNLI